jgi:hypothetical protein
MKLGMNNVHVYDIPVMFICKSCSTSIICSNCFLPYKPGFLSVSELFISEKHIVIFGVSFKTLEHVVFSQLVCLIFVLGQKGLFLPQFVFK